MATTVVESESKHSPGDYPNAEKPISLEEAASSLIKYGVQQAQLLHKTLDDAVNSSIEASRSRFSEILSTSSAHLQQTIESLKEVKSEYDAYEDIAVGKIKEGILVAASNPLVTSGVCAGLGFLLVKRPWKSLYYNTLRLLVSEEVMVDRARVKVKELQKSIDRLMADSEELEKKALLAEGEMERGRVKLRQTGRRIHGVIRTAYKIESQAKGLKDILGELPPVQVSRLRSRVSQLASETKRNRSALSKVVTKISNYGISV